MGGTITAVETEERKDAKLKLSPIGEVHIDELLGKTVRAGCRQMDLRAGEPPHTRSCHGDTESGLLAYEPFGSLDLQQIIYAILTDNQIKQLKHEGALFFLYSVVHLAEFEAYVIHSQAGVEAGFLVAQS